MYFDEIVYQCRKRVYKCCMSPVDIWLLAGNIPARPGWAGLGPLLEMSHWVTFITAAITLNCSIRIKLSWTKWTVKLVSQTKNK